MRIRARVVASLSVVAVALVVAAVAATTTAGASSTKPARRAASPWAADQPGVQHLHFKYGPIQVQPGQNNISFSEGQVPKPQEDGFIVGIHPNLRTADGKVPPVDVIHLHHAVWLNMSAERNRDRGVPNFFAAGEEKTIMKLPNGYGYPYRASDVWVLNYMIHDLTPGPYQVFVTYDLDFVPSSSPAAQQIKPARPIWMDVQNGSIYPVFDVLKGSGTNGQFTYPDQANNPYPNGRPKNVWKVDRDSVLLGTAGHLHPGGLHDDLYVDRTGDTGGGGPGDSPAQTTTQTAHIFRSVADYFEPAGAVSWDVSMTATPPNWFVQVHPGDQLRITTTYDTKRASWYESMGIMIVWMADGTYGRDPFTTKVDTGGELTHGHLPENNHHGGQKTTLPSVTKFAPTDATEVPIDDFLYGVGDFTGDHKIPRIKAGQSITFTNNDAPKGNGIWHSITSCRAPCNKETGVAYPLADGGVQFDSGQLGAAGPPSSGSVTWQTPTNLPPGTYTYFCRIHPFMRGAFQVSK
jgi:plastocyanin